MPKPKVVTIHGMKSNRLWQSQVKRVLEPHFECVSIEYPQFERFGALKLLFGQAFFSLFVVAIPIEFVLRKSIIGKIGWLVLALLLTASYIEARKRLESLVRFIRVQLDQKLEPWERPHLVAHSLGTLVIGSLIATFEEVRFRRIVLIGCVLPRRFDWSRPRENLAFESIRNELGRKDWVVRFAGLFGWLIPEIGNSGFAGFEGVRTRDERRHRCFIHLLGSQFQRCSECGSNSEAAGDVYNVLIPRFGHKDAFVTASHALTFWLPFFWGIDIEEYREFLDMCWEASYRESEQMYAELGIVEGELGDSYFSWTRGLSLRERIRAEITASIEEHLKRGASPIGTLDEQALDRIEDRALRLLWRVVSDARREAFRRGQRSDDSIRALNPTLAIACAVNTMVRRSFAASGSDKVIDDKADQWKLKIS